MQGVYLLHFSHKLHHAGHYIGWSSDIEARFALHRKGKSQVALVRAAVQSGIELYLVRIWEGEDRHFERWLKEGKRTPQLCPVCRGKNGNGDTETAQRLAEQTMAAMHH